MSYLELIARSQNGLNTFLQQLRFAYRLNQHVTWVAPVILTSIALVALSQGDFVVAALILLPGMVLFSVLWYVHRETYDQMWQLILLRNHILAGTRNIREPLVIEQIGESSRVLNLMTQFVMSGSMSCMLLAVVGSVSTIWYFFQPKFESTWLSMMLVLGLFLTGIAFLAQWTYRTRLRDTMHYSVNSCNIRFRNYFQVRSEITPEQMATEVMAGNGDYQPNPEIRRRLRRAAGPNGC